MESTTNNSTTLRQGAEQVFAWAESVIRDVIENAGKTVDDSAAIRLRDVWMPACIRFAENGRVTARLRASRETMTFHVTNFGEAITLASEGDTVTADDVTVGMLDYATVKAFTPQCPFPWEIEAASGIREAVAV